MFFYISDISALRIKKIKTINYIFKEHNSEFNSRIYLLIFLFFLFSIISIINCKDLTKILQLAASSKVKFFQASPSDFFFESIKLSIYSGFLIIFPIFIIQIITFFLPGFSYKEKKISLPITFLSILLFLSSILVSFFLLLPVTFLFFLNYNKDLIEPFWSFTEYFDFLITIFLGNGLMFQLPIIQFLFNSLKIITLDNMISNWKLVVIISTIFGAIITPTTDPITQLLLSLIIILLYFLGILLIKLINKT